MKKKKWIIIGVVMFVIIVAVVLTISQSSKWSEVSFEAVVQETITQQDGEIRLIVKRTTEIYESPFNSLSVGNDTELIDKDGNKLTILDFKKGDTVKVTLKNAFTEEMPFQQFMK